MKRISDIRRKVMQIANKLVRSGLTRANAMRKAWQLLKTRLVTKVVGTTFDNRQNVLALLAKYRPSDITVKLVRDSHNSYDSNAVAVTATVKGKVNAVIGYLSRAVANVVAALMDKGLEVLSDTLCIVGGVADLPTYGAKFIITI